MTKLSRERRHPWRQAWLQPGLPPGMAALAESRVRREKFARLTAALFAGGRSRSPCSLSQRSRRSEYQSARAFRGQKWRMGTAQLENRRTR